MQHAIDGARLEHIDVATLQAYFRDSTIAKAKVEGLVDRLEDLRVRGQGGDWSRVADIEP